MTGVTRMEPQRGTRKLRSDILTVVVASRVGRVCRHPRLTVHSLNSCSLLYVMCIDKPQESYYDISAQSF